jgi:hypothetical protein
LQREQLEKSHKCGGQGQAVRYDLIVKNGARGVQELDYVEPKGQVVVGEAF